jgi:hypothetical protein
MPDDLISRFTDAVRQVARLEQYERYEGAFVFGSFVTGNLHEKSDLDVVVVLADGEPACQGLSHPRINGIRLDISFNRLESIAQAQAEIQQKGQRKPYLLDSQILFDRQGRLRTLQEQFRATAKPEQIGSEQARDVQYDLYYAFTKPGKYLPAAPETAEMIMHIELKDVLRAHYRLHGKWWVSDKHLLEDLGEWDIPMRDLLRSFLLEKDTGQRYLLWQRMIEHVLLAVGGKDFTPFEADCACEQCQGDLQRLAGDGETRRHGDAETR